mmetsp:Transcript_43176/g.82858  ORF Transcript_43176/g.82858 Transcript_43176/m.82858 type:complete len:111 (-) Transcript_43176:65-397(-)
MKKKLAMKAMKKKAMKKKVSIIAKGRFARRQVFEGKKVRTMGGIKVADLVKNKSGKLVTKKASAKGKKSAWAIATKKAREELAVTGFVPIGGKTPEGKALLAKIKELYQI